MEQIAAPPLQDSVIELDETPARRDPFYMAKGWIIWIQNSLIPRVQSGVQLLTTKSLSGQAAAIGATPVPLPVLSAGMYRIAYYARITTPASVSSSLTVTIGWTEGGVALTLAGPALTGNVATSVQSGEIVVRIDRASAITYATTYATSGTDMQYSLDICVEQLN